MKITRKQLAKIKNYYSGRVIQKADGTLSFKDDYGNEKTVIHCVIKQINDNAIEHTVTMEHETGTNKLNFVEHVPGDYDPYNLLACRISLLQKRFDLINSFISCSKNLFLPKKIKNFTPDEEQDIESDSINFFIFDYKGLEFEVAIDHYYDDIEVFYLKNKIITCSINLTPQKTVQQLIKKILVQTDKIIEKQEKKDTVVKEVEKMASLLETNVTSQVVKLSFDKSKGVAMRVAIPYGQMSEEKALVIKEHFIELAKKLG